MVQIVSRNGFVNFVHTATFHRRSNVQCVEVINHRLTKIFTVSVTVSMPRRCLISVRLTPPGSVNRATIEIKKMTFSVFSATLQFLLRVSQFLFLTSERPTFREPNRVK